MAWTSHGHHIDGTVFNSTERPKSIARCGGPRTCFTCAREAGQAFKVPEPDILLRMRVTMREDLLELLEAINGQIEEVKVAAEKLDCKPQQVQTTTGDFLLSPLLVAKAGALSALVQLGLG